MVSIFAITLVILLVPFWAPTLVTTKRSPMRTAALRLGIGALVVAAALLLIQFALFPVGPLTLLPLDLGLLWLGTAPFWVPLLAVRAIQLGFRDRAQVGMEE